ncbi:unnamed protein product [Cylicocyclus nassatus]|uniref:Zinc metalloproteinase n=1 Tax=Cylicocyclus nassatus TaxID=53992 RepID=A0AA36GJW2_CYLNA|nr:unnamed protein product [Cylicocyclus nassatus]
MSLFLFLPLLLAANSAAETVVERIDRALSEIPLTVNKAEVLANHEMLQAHADEIKEELRLSPQREEILQRIEAELQPIQHTEHGNSTIEQVNAQAQIGDLLYQSDIILTPQQAEAILGNDVHMELDRSKRQALNWKHWVNYQWPDDTLYYAFTDAIDSRTRDIFRKAARLWQQGSCVTFIESDAAQHYVLVTMEPACSSYVGCIHQGAQRLRLGNGCHLIGTAAHELGHALGMYHTHSRHDRDQYLIINTHNIQPGKESQFNKETIETSNNYGIPFDYGSIMNYATDSMISYSLEKQKGMYTMVPLDSKYIDTMGSNFISFYDMLLLNNMYDCLKKCNAKQRSPARSRVKRGTITRTKTYTDKNGKITKRVTITHSSSGGSFNSDDGFGFGGFFDPMGSLGNIGGMDFSGWGSIFGGSNGGGLSGEEGGSDGGSIFGGSSWSSIFRGSNGRQLPGEEGGSNGGNKLPGKEGSNTGGKTNWDKLPGEGGERPSQPSGPSGPSYETAKCANGGYPNPRDCSICNCPGGYGGRLCNERPDGPGKVLQAKSNWQKIETLVGYNNVYNTNDKDDFLFEYYWIQAPRGRKIEVKVDDITPNLETPGCYWFGVEVKAQKDQRLTGYRFCSATYKGKTYKSEGNLVPIIMYSRIWRIKMNLSYRMGTFFLSSCFNPALSTATAAASYLIVKRIFRQENKACYYRLVVSNIVKDAYVQTKRYHPL